MAIDASIYQNIRQPEAPNLLAQYGQIQQIQGAQQQNRLLDLKMQQARREQQQDDAQREAVKSFGTDTTANTNRLLGTGNLKAATDYQKTVTEQQKAAREAEKARIEGAVQKVGFIGQSLAGVQDQAGYAAARQRIVSLIPEAAGDMPEVFNPQEVQTAMQRALTVKDQLEQKWKAMEYTTPNANARLSADTTTRGQDLTDKRTREEGAANRSLTARGQNMADARARESTAATLTKPFEITGEDGKPVLVQQDKQGNIRPVQGYTPKQGASKPLTEGQSKALLFGSRMQEANAILDALEAKGTTTSIPGARAGFGVGSAISAMQPAELQQLDQAKRDFINAVLRRESGAVIADSEFNNGDKQYFPQVGDSPAVIAQKKKNREVATRGILAEVPGGDARVAEVRGGGVAPAATPEIDALLKKYGGR